MRPCCIHFGGERNSKINENLPVRIQQAATNNIITSSNWSFVLKNQPTKKRGGGGIGGATIVVPCIRITSRTLWTITNRLEAGPAAKGRDNEGQMLRSHVSFGLVATCNASGTCSKQQLPLFFNLTQVGPRKEESRISEVPDRRGILTSRQKNGEKKHFLLHSYEYAS